MLRRVCSCLFQDTGQKFRRVSLSEDILRALGFAKNGAALGTGAGQFGQRFGQVTPLRPITSTAATGGITITGDVTVVAENPDAFLRELQKKAGRTSATARGRFPGRSMGLA